jgi:hypothetical protein
LVYCAKSLKQRDYIERLCLYGERRWSISAYNSPNTVKIKERENVCGAQSLTFSWREGTTNSSSPFTHILNC